MENKSKNKSSASKISSGTKSIRRVRYGISIPRLFRTVYTQFASIQICLVVTEK